MRKTLIAGLALSLVTLGLAGCGGSGGLQSVTHTSSTPSVSASSFSDDSVAPSPADSPDTASFLAFVRQNIPEAAGASDSHLINLGENICSEVADDDSLASIAQQGEDAGFTPYHAGEYIGASVATFCPQYIPQVKAQASALASQ